MATGVYAVEIPEFTIQSAIGASYTVPENYYAKAKVKVASGDFKINTVSVIDGDNGHTVLASSLLRVNTNISAGVGGIGSPDFNAGAGTLRSTGLVTLANTLINDATAYADNDGTTLALISAAAKTAIPGLFVINQGDTVVGSGDCKYHLELYRMPGT